MWKGNISYGDHQKGTFSNFYFINKRVVRFHILPNTVLNLTVKFEAMLIKIIKVWNVLIKIRNINGGLAREVSRGVLPSTYLTTI